ncbi:MAG: peptidoglycan binding domain-containing protein [Parcubacteria group bacterium Gr01-1014_8]|nr:MAG: peptidoglycan binding domain-containing protein [Parcubacteria group bacterium Gr01-1014_8]
MVKKALIGGLIASSLVFSIGIVPVSALTVDDLQSQVQRLMAQIADLTRQLNELRGQPPVPPIIGSIMPSKHRICSVLVRNLTTGTNGDDVRSLQEFLNEQGYLSANATGYFGHMTTQAVAKWQAAEGVQAIGAFGPMSRERLRIWCGGGGNENFRVIPQRGAAPLSVTFYTNISGFHSAADNYIIEYGDGSTESAANCYAPTDRCQRPGTNTHTYTSNGTYMALLVHTSNPCGVTQGCMAPISREVIGKVQVYVGDVACTKEYKPVCGSKPIVCITTPCNPIQQTYSNRCMMEADGASFMHAGECRAGWQDPANDPQCKRWTDGKVCGTSCHREFPGGEPICVAMMCAPAPGTVPPDRAPYCTAWFDEFPNNKPPVISGFSGPTTLVVNTTGTWNVNAWDPENERLSYSVRWGDENSYPIPANASMAERPFVQMTTFTHAYSFARVYTVTIVVRNASGQEARTSTTVNVTGGMACTGEYAPVCGQPPEPACRHSIPACMLATPGPTTYSNRCFMNAAGAAFLYVGQCEIYTACTQEAMQCPNGTWVGRTGPNCQFVCP